MASHTMSHPVPQALPDRTLSPPGRAATHPIRWSARPRRGMLASGAGQGIGDVNKTLALALDSAT
jgi:hypothetical protein